MGEIIHIDFARRCVANPATPAADQCGAAAGRLYTCLGCGDQHGREGLCDGCEATAEQPRKRRGRISLKRERAFAAMPCMCGACIEMIARGESCWIGWSESQPGTRARIAISANCFDAGRFG